MGDIYSNSDLRRDDKGRIEIDEAGNVYVENNLPDMKLGSVFPKANLAWRNDFRWKGVNLGFLIAARIGGVVYSAAGVADQTLAQGWHLLSPLKKVSKFPASQQQIVFSDDPADYGEKEHADWSIDAPADGGMVKINLTVNYNFMPDRVVELFNRFNGMNGETLVESRIQNSIIAYPACVRQMEKPQGGHRGLERPEVRRDMAAGLG